MGQEIYSVQEPVEENPDDDPDVEELLEKDPVVEEPVEKDPVVEEPVVEDPVVEDDPVVENELVEIQQEMRPRKKFTLKRVHKNRKTRRTKLKKKFMRPPTPHLM
jgi:hypothetical protein